MIVSLGEGVVANSTSGQSIGLIREIGNAFLKKFDLLLSQIPRPNFPCYLSIVSMFSTFQFLLFNIIMCCSFFSISKWPLPIGSVRIGSISIKLCLFGTRESSPMWKQWVFCARLLFDTTPARVNCHAQKFSAHNRLTPRMFALL